MDGLLYSVPGLVALGGAVLALLALLFAAVLGVKLRRLRRAQVAVLGGGEERDLVRHAEHLGTGFVELSEMVESVLDGAESRLADMERRLDGCVAHSALVRYDAYGEMSGHQSSSLALLDARHSGLVLSSIHNRDQARVYVKRVHEGRADLQLSPEEQEAVGVALGTAPSRASEHNGRSSV